MFFEKRGNLFVGRFGQLFGNKVVLHGFSTREGGVSTFPYDSLNVGFQTGDLDDHILENRRRFFQAVGISSEQVAVPEQVHGDHVIKVDNPGKYSKADGLVTNRPEIALSVQVADCLPIFFYDPVQKAIGLVHAGWKGTALEISQKAVTVMTYHYRTKPEDLNIFFGPSIGPCCYTVGSDVADRFSEKYISGGKLDLWQSNRDQLVYVGVQSQHIVMSRLCTVCHPEWFFSHRHSGRKTGRMAATFMLKKKNLTF